MSRERFWLWSGDIWIEVDKAEYVRCERAAGFRNTMGQPDESATSSFANGQLRGTTFDPYDATVFYSIVGPRWRRRWFRSGRTPLGSRRWFRWQVVRETRPSRGESGMAWEHHSLHWTEADAFREAQRAQKAWRAARAGGVR